MVITSSGNPYVRLIKSLHTKKGRAQHGLFLIEGEKLVREALELGARLHSFAVSKTAAQDYEALADCAKRQGVSVHVLEDRVLSFAADVQTPQGVVAAVHSWDLTLPDGSDALPDTVVALERVQDPGNMGTILRTAEAAGAGAIVLSPGCCEPFSPKVVRSAAGSVLRMKIYETADFPGFLIRCGEAGYAVVAGSLDGENVFKIEMSFQKLVLMIGNEANGLSDAALSFATHRVRIPMAGGTESLNAGVASGILLYELLRNALEKM